MSPDGKGMLTEYRPGHHPHPTGVSPHCGS